MDRLLSGIGADNQEPGTSGQFMDMLWRDVQLEEDLAEDIELEFDDDLSDEDLDDDAY